MRYVFLVLSLLMLLLGMFIEANAQSALHEIEGAIAILNFAVLLVGYQVASLAAELRKRRSGSGARNRGKPY